MVTTTSEPRTMTCGYCRQEFTEDTGQPTCQACPLAGACRFVRCPHCGYENPAEPAVFARLRRLFGGRDDT